MVMTISPPIVRLAHLRVISAALVKHLYKPCPYCNRRMETRPLNLRPTRDHVYPKSKNRYPNRLIICCTRCNHDKGALWLEDWLAKLIAANDPRAFLVDVIAKRYPRVDT
jgi:5-methylcytosine-specific restriction endonuclease McrA